MSIFRKEPVRKAPELVIDPSTGRVAADPRLVSATLSQARGVAEVIEARDGEKRQVYRDNVPCMIRFAGQPNFIRATREQAWFGVLTRTAEVYPEQAFRELVLAD